MVGTEERIPIPLMDYILNVVSCLIVGGGRKWFLEPDLGRMVPTQAGRIPDVMQPFWLAHLFVPSPRCFVAGMRWLAPVARG